MSLLVVWDLHALGHERLMILTRVDLEHWSSKIQPLTSVKDPQPSVPVQLSPCCPPVSTQAFLLVSQLNSRRREQAQATQKIQSTSRGLERGVVARRLHARDCRDQIPWHWSTGMNRELILSKSRANFVTSYLDTKELHGSLCLPKKWANRSIASEPLDPDWRADSGSFFLI